MSKMKRTYNKRLVLIATLLVGLGWVSSCHKDQFLDKKPTTTLTSPTSLSDFQALLDNTNVVGLTPVLGEMSADNFYLTPVFWQNINTKEHNAYIWAPDIYNGQGLVDDWDVPYQQVFYSNVVLQGLPEIKVDITNATQWNTIMGSALFTRSFAFFNLAQVFAPPCDGNAKSNPLGIPLRLSPDVNSPTIRSTVGETYAQILSDLQKAATLLPITIPVNNLNRPSRPAALALLARVYLSMRNYSMAGVYADSCLRLYSSLLDYNLPSVDTTQSIPIRPGTNVELLYQSSFLRSTQVLLGLFNAQLCIIDSSLYQSYSNNDRRRVVFYKTTLSGSPYLRGSYNQTIYPFSGLATDEMYLVRAECSARNGNADSAIDDLNTLLSYRYRKGSFVPFTAGTSTEALDTILLERRKELAFRGLRWTDLRRLNKEGANIVLTRNIGGTIYTLQPTDSNLYTLPIPPDVLNLSGIRPNPR
jgi:hypothetical protein